MRGRGIWCALVVGCLVLGAFAVCDGAEPERTEKKVLLIYSFTINFAPDFQIVTAFNKTLSAKDIKLRVKHVELNAFEQGDAVLEALEQRIEPYLAPIQAGEYDVIIPVGQIAIDLLQRHSAAIPDGTAIAFCGLDISTMALFRAHPNTTGAQGRVSVPDNIELGLHFYPNTKRIILLADWSICGQRVLEAARYGEPSYPGIECVYLDNAAFDLNQMLDFIAQQDADTLVLFYSWFNTDSTNLASLQYIMSHLERGAAPVLALQEPMLWDGAIGGIYTPVAEVGIALAERVARILNGEAASQITIAAVGLDPVVNWAAVQDGRIAEADVPPGIVWNGKAVFIRDEDLPLVIVIVGSLAIVAGLLVLISILFLRLRRVTGKAQAILKHIPGRLLVSDCDGHLLFVHFGAASCDNSASKLKLETLPCFDHAVIQNALREVLTTGTPQTVECDFSERRHRIELVKISADIFGVDAILWVLNDIDELYRTQQKLDKALCESQLTLDSVTDAVIVTDHRARITHLNPAACAILDGDYDCIVGRPVGDCFRLRREDQGDAEPFSLSEAILNEVRITQMYDYTLCVARTEVRNIVFNLSPIINAQGGSIGSVLTMRDITPLKDYQNKLLAAMHEAQAANAAKSNFIAAISHELRTPLNAVIGFSEMLRSDELGAEERLEYVDGINLAGNALLALINDILDLSKIEAGRMVIAPVATDLKAMCRELQAIFRQSATRKGIEFFTRYDDDLPTLYLDGVRLRQILLNLIGNALKFTHRGSVAVEVCLERQTAEFGCLSIAVIDTGIGVKPENRERIFEKFVQQDAVRDSFTYKGSGLGLTIAMQLARRMDGTIEVESEPGKGSTFTVRLERVPYAVEASPAAGETARSENSVLTAAGLSFLVVDDVALNVKVLSAMLKKYHIDAAAALSGEEALESMARRTPDVVLTDMWMKDGMSGAELAVAIRRNPAWAGVKIIAVTADSEVAGSAAQENFDGVLLKPLTGEKLSDFLKSL